MSAPANLLADLFRDRYTIERELGRGGMATVYLATDLKLQRQVALKVLRPELGATLGNERFLREIAIAARLNHPHILTLHDSGQAASHLYYVMPYVEGESLRQRLEREGQLPVPVVLAIVRAVASGLTYAHQHGVIHRDIKPENILLAGNASSGLPHPWIADFGIARALDLAAGERLTETGLTLGTPAYMSPEQSVGGSRLDGRSDTYALGCVAYEMLAGEPPFTGPTPQAIIAKRFSEPVPHLRTIRDVPEGIEHAITRALARSPADRFTSAAEFASALDAPVGGQLVHTGPRAGARGRRFRFIGLGVVTALAALGVSLWRSRGLPEPPLDANLVAVAPFDVVDPSLRLWREGLMDLLSRSLDGAGALRTVSPATFIKHWSGRADPVSSRALGRRTGARLVVFGSLLRGGRDSVRLRAALLDLASDAPAAEVEVQGDTSRMDRLTDSLAVALLRGLGRARPVSAVRNSPLGARSLPALKAYLQGEQLYRRGMWDSALMSYDRAIALDSSFALAYRRMALVLWWDPETSKTYEGFGEYALRAAALNRGLAPRDSLLITAGSLMAKLDPAEDTAFFQHYHQLSATLEEATRRYPGDPEVWYLSGEHRFHSGTLPAAAILKLFDRAIELDSTFGPAYEHTVQLAIKVGGPDLANRYIMKYLDLGSTDALAEGVRLAQMLLDTSRANTAEANRLLDTMSAVPLWNAIFNLNRWPDSAETSVRLARSLSSGRRSFRGAPPFVADSLVRRLLLALTLGYRGHVREASRVVRDSYRAAGLPRADGYFNPFIDLALLGMVPADTVAAVLSILLDRGEFWPPRFVQGVALPWWSARHDTLSLEKFARSADSAAHVGGSQIARSYAEYLGDAARAYFALARLDSATALKLLVALPDSACLVNDCFFEKLTEAQLYAARAQDREAAKVLDEWLDTRDLSPLFILGTLERGRTAERLGERVLAATSYQFVADVWRKADPELQPYVAEARAGLARLGGEDQP